MNTMKSFVVFLAMAVCLTCLYGCRDQHHHDDRYYEDGYRDRNHRDRYHQDSDRRYNRDYRERNRNRDDSSANQS